MTKQQIMLAIQKVAYSIKAESGITAQIDYLNKPECLNINVRRTPNACDKCNVCGKPEFLLFENLFVEGTSLEDFERALEMIKVIADGQ